MSEHTTPGPDDSDNDTPITVQREHVDSTNVSSTYKVLGELDDGSGTGVLGRNIASSGTPIGVEGAVPDGSGGFGLSTPNDARIQGTTVTSTAGPPAGTPLTLTTDDGIRALQLGVPGTDNPGETAGANVVGGHPDNSATNAVGATVSGGGSSGSSTVDGESRANTNEVQDNYGTVGGGRNNRAGNEFDGLYSTARFATVGGGKENTANGPGATVSGGRGNTASGVAATAGGGDNNTVAGSQATLGGGSNNEGYGGSSTIGGGSGNRTGEEGTTKGSYATVPGGRDNTASANDSFAAGRQAQAVHEGAFVWADSTDATVESTAADQFLIEAAGGVGVGTTAPETQFDIVDSVSGAASVSNHVALIENESGAGSADVLAMKIGEPASEIGGENNFISFKDSGENSMGAIEGDGNGNVTLAAAGADYAEYVPRLDADETIEPGDIVGIVDGAVTKRTAEAVQALVVSDRALVAGNSPGPNPDDRIDHEVCAFVGQVPVAVHGPVDGGDLVVPSGDHDGTGRAFAPEDYRPGDGPIVGRAWEESDEEGLTEVTVAVGLETGEALEAALTAQQETITELRERLSALEDRVRTVEAGGGAEQATADD